MSIEKRLLTIPVVVDGVRGTEEREARIIGDLAVVQSVADHAGWNVWHVPTMNLFDKARPASLPSRCSVRRLMEWCEKVQSDHVEIWEAMRKLGMAPSEEAKAACNDARGVLLAYCRGVDAE